MNFFSSASENNKQPILEKLTDYFIHAEAIFEVGSGSGQHAMHFCAQIPQLVWQTTEQREAVSGLAENIEKFAPDNVRLPIELDVTQPIWPIKNTPAIYTANSLHIMSADCVSDFFLGVGRVLDENGTVFIYGPFKYQGKFTTLSNAHFDDWLKARDLMSGVRDIEMICDLAQDIGLQLMFDYSMPANNQLLIFRQTA